MQGHYSASLAEDCVSPISRAQLSPSLVGYLSSLRPRRQESIACMRLRLPISQYRFGGAERPAVEDVSFALEPGQMVMLIGPNGSGKTTLLRAILGLIPARGEVRSTANLSGRPIHSLAMCHSTYVRPPPSPLQAVKCSSCRFAPSLGKPGVCPSTGPLTRFAWRVF